MSVSLLSLLYVFISFSHVHIFKYEGIAYTPTNLGYTRIGLVDSNKNSLFFIHCRFQGASTSCFHIMERPSPKMMQEQCHSGEIPLEEFEDYQYMLNESLFFENSRKDRVLISKTNNLIPNFVDNLLKYF
jgi:hypothetical protein